jgi:hypothetical protein
VSALEMDCDILDDRIFMAAEGCCCICLADVRFWGEASSRGSYAGNGDVGKKMVLACRLSLLCSRPSEFPVTARTLISWWPKSCQTKRPDVTR